MGSRMNETKTILRFLITLSLVFLVGCGGSTTNVTTKPSSTQEGVVDIGGLHIQGGKAGCAYDIRDNSNLVLATDSQDYDIGQLQQIKSYVSDLYHNSNQGRQPPPPPNTLRWLLGTMTPEDFSRGQLPCVTSLEITNTGEKAVQIVSLAMKLVVTPKINDISYRLIEGCSVISMPVPCAPPTGFGSGLSYSFKLKNAAAGTTFAGEVGSSITNDPTQPILKSGELSVMDIFFSSEGSPDNLIYTVTPELTISSGGGQTQNLELTQLISDVSFAHAEQFSCYQLQGTTFVSVPQEYVTNRSESHPVWCF